MNTKAIARIVVVVVVVAAVTAYIALGDDDENDGFVDVVYDGNGGTYEGKDTYRLTSTNVLDNMFRNGNYQFIEWNTKADGSGTSYRPDDTISYPAHGYVKLYAQWSTEKVYSVFSYFESIGLPQTSDISLYLDGTMLSIVSAPDLTVSGSEVIIIRYADSCTDWTWNEDLTRFEFVCDGQAYFLMISITGAESQIGFMSDDGIPCYGFVPTSDVAINVMVHQVR